MWSGKIASVHVDRFRYDDGEEAEREIVAHPGAVAVVAHDGERIYLVEQPREPVGEDALLELPAGKLDDEGEDVLETAKRELTEEIGKGAREWKHLTTFWGSPGFSDEEVLLYIGDAQPDGPPEPDDSEGDIEVVEMPLAEAVRAVRDGRITDGKSAVALLLASTP